MVVVGVHSWLSVRLNKQEEMEKERKRKEEEERQRRQEEEMKRQYVLRVLYTSLFVRNTDSIETLSTWLCHKFYTLN